MHTKEGKNEMHIQLKNAWPIASLGMSQFVSREQEQRWSNVTIRVTSGGSLGAMKRVMG